MIKCNACGAVVPDGARFCTECGSPLEITFETTSGDSFESPFEMNTSFDESTGSLNQEPEQRTWNQAPQGQYQGGSQGQYQAGSQAQYQGWQGQNQTPQGQYQGGFYGGNDVGQVGQKSKIAAGILAILLGSLGVHKFYLGYTSTGVIMLLVSLFGALAFGLGPIIMGIISLVEGIIYLTKSDYDFYETYEIGEKKWF